MEQAGKLNPVIGRDGETKRVMNTLSRIMKNNALLIGEPLWLKDWLRGSLKGMFLRVLKMLGSLK